MDFKMSAKESLKTVSDLPDTDPKKHSHETGKLLRVRNSVYDNYNKGVDEDLDRMLDEIW